MIEKVADQIAKTLQKELNSNVEVTIRGNRGSKLELTISGSQFQAMKAAKFMADSKLATITEAVSYIDDPGVAYFYLTA